METLPCWHAEDIRACARQLETRERRSNITMLSDARSDCLTVGEGHEAVRGSSVEARRRRLFAWLGRGAAQRRATPQSQPASQRPRRRASPGVSRRADRNAAQLPARRLQHTHAALATPRNCIAAFRGGLPRTVAGCADVLVVGLRPRRQQRRAVRAACQRAKRRGTAR